MIVLISESLLQRASACDGRILRDRVLHESELPAWKLAVNWLGERQRDFLYLSLYAGLRRNKGRELQRKQIDLARGVLVVPMTKNGKAHSLQHAKAVPY